MLALGRFTRNRPRLTTALLAGLIVGLVLPDQWQLVTRILAGWNIAVWSYLILMGWVMTHADHERVRKIAEQEEENAIAVLVILSICASLSIIAIIFELSTIKGSPFSVRLGHYIFTILTVLGSWFLVGIIFTFHYAYLFYREYGKQQPLHFPEGKHSPNYWDFLYFSFTIAVAAQTSDISVMTREMRKVVLAQSVLSFLFNAAILGLSVNIAASMVGPS
jgi:uncharacterized membrane protein